MKLFEAQVVAKNGSESFGSVTKRAPLLSGCNGSVPVVTTTSPRLIFLHCVSYSIMIFIFPTSAADLSHVLGSSATTSEFRAKHDELSGQSDVLSTTLTLMKPGAVRNGTSNIWPSKATHHRKVHPFPRVRRKWCKTLYMSSKDSPSPRVGSSQVHLPDVYTDVTARSAVAPTYPIPLVRNLARQPLSESSLLSLKSG